MSDPDQTSGADGDLPPQPPPVHARAVRFEFTETKQPHRELQLQELQLFSSLEGGSPIRIKHIANPGGRSPLKQLPQCQHQDQLAPMMRLGYITCLKNSWYRRRDHLNGQTSQKSRKALSLPKQPTQSGTRPSTTGLSTSRQDPIRLASAHTRISVRT